MFTDGTLNCLGTTVSGLFSHNFFTCWILIQGRCHDLPPLNEFSSVVLSCFTLSRQTSWMEVLLSWTWRLAQTIVQGYCLFRDMGQEKCEYVYAYNSSRTIIQLHKSLNRSNCQAAESHRSMTWNIAKKQLMHSNKCSSWLHIAVYSFHWKRYVLKTYP